MTKLIPAIYEHGTFKLSGHLEFKLPEHQKVLIAIAINNDEIPSMLISKLAEGSESLAFLNNPEENIYSLFDGKEI
ncbi:MAG: DUF104 domain-containing protein [Candidatus Omnitrophica bacterium]|nr:DUF104 domain-containing protein [Candidatus Omnitrophota bacterium]MBU0879140.1 DUF104 domain-containing protein [Candidatus Omnitrophota bacterium]MBU0896959.1 DUF104 domain-containing protein [Candidatus Omnitrophota bacterium]MBU1133424.1 DUF104 domain-containing protein [Candidatus Omnitrophota bacterium]MBU1367301.1 DUF104 domain-containing protein [Candidatus Omnitrophota bacterium]